jgi:hypothetical protein
VGITNPSEDKRMVELVLECEGKSHNKKSRSKYSAMGASILSTVFGGFDLADNNCKMAVDSLLSVKPDALVEMACDPTASRVIDAALDGSMPSK